MNFDRLTLRSGASEMLRMADMPPRSADREDRLLDRLDRFHRVGRRHAAAGAVPGTGRGVLPLRPALPRRAAGAVDRFLVANFLWRATLLASVNAGLPARGC
jgi:hypothetical protein